MCLASCVCSTTCVWPLMAFMCTFSGCVREAAQKDAPLRTEMELSSGFPGDGERMRQRRGRGGNSGELITAQLLAPQILFSKGRNLEGGATGPMRGRDIYIHDAVCHLGSAGLLDDSTRMEFQLRNIAFKLGMSSGTSLRWQHSAVSFHVLQTCNDTVSHFRSSSFGRTEPLLLCLSSLEQLLISHRSVMNQRNERSNLIGLISNQ